MQLDLIDRRNHTGGGDDPLQVRGVEVGHANRAGGTELHRAWIRPSPGLDVLIPARLGPMDQIQVDVLESEPLEAFLQGLDGSCVAMGIVVALGRDEDLIARQPGGAERLADSMLIGDTSAPCRCGGSPRAVPRRSRPR